MHTVMDILNLSTLKRNGQTEEWLKVNWWCQIYTRKCKWCWEREWMRVRPRSIRMKYNQKKKGTKQKWKNKNEKKLSFFPSFVIEMDNEPKWMRMLNAIIQKICMNETNAPHFVLSLCSKICEQIGYIFYGNINV